MVCFQNTRNRGPLSQTLFCTHRSKLEEQPDTEVGLMSEEVVWSLTLDLKVATFGCGHCLKAWLLDLIVWQRHQMPTGWS